MARTRRLRRNFEERGSRVEDTDRATVDRARVREKPSFRRDGGAPRPERAVRERGDTVTPPRRRRRRPKETPKPPRAVDRKLYAHERPPLEPLPQRPDREKSLDNASGGWRPADVPTEKTPTVAGFSLGAALLSVPITGIRFCVNLGLHAAALLSRRVRALLEQPLPD